MRVYSPSHWLVIFCTTNSSRVQSWERWQTFENSWKKTQYLTNTLYQPTEMIKRPTSPTNKKLLLEGSYLQPNSNDPVCMFRVSFNRWIYQLNPENLYQFYLNSQPSHGCKSMSRQNVDGADYDEYQRGRLGLRKPPFFAKPHVRQHRTEEGTTCCRWDKYVF